MAQTTILLDVRDDIRSGREPFTRIMTAAAGAREGQRLLLLAPFEPIPLVNILNQQGFCHTATRTESGDWEVLFVRESTVEQKHATPPETRRSAAPAKARVADSIEVDARGLEPPLPMVKILEALAALPAGAELRARTDRRPLHLYAQLEERGFSGNTMEQSDGTFLTHIRRS